MSHLFDSASVAVVLILGGRIAFRLIKDHLRIPGRLSVLWVEHDAVVAWHCLTVIDGRQDDVHRDALREGGADQGLRIVVVTRATHTDWSEGCGHTGTIISCIFFSTRVNGSIFWNL